MALEDLNDWMTRAQAAADEAMANFAQRMGYDPDDQDIRLAGDAPQDLSDMPAECSALFATLDEISWPDIWNGYFIGPASEMIRRYRDHEIDMVIVDFEAHRAFVVGSDGGGAYFAVDLDSESVLRVSDATVQEGSLHGLVEVVAPSLDSFLEALIENARAFAHGRAPRF